MVKRAHETSGPTRAAVYCRVSTSAQEDNSSLGTQEARCRAYAEERGWAVVAVYREVYSGAELFERPQLAALREAVRRDEADAVVAFALDRVSRNQAHLGFLLSEWDHAGVPLGLVTEELVDTPEGRLLQSVRGFVAEVERLKIAERTKRGTRARVTSGRPIVGQKAPFGYRWRDDDKSGYEFDPNAESIIRRIFDSVIAGATLRSIATALTAEAIPTPTGRGKRWEVSSLHGILKNPIYAGRPSAYRWSQQRDRGKYRTVLRPESEWVSLPIGTAPAILSEEQFQAIQARLAYNRATAPRNNADPEATLLRCGIAHCGYCDAPLSVTRREGQGHSYRCHPVGRERHGCPSFQIRAAILDTAVWRKVEEVLTRPEVIAAEVERRATVNPYAADLASLDRRLDAIGRQRDRLARAVATLDDEEAVAPLLTELQSLASQAKALRGEQVILERNATQSALVHQRLVDLATWCDRVADRIPQLTYEEKRMVLGALGTKVVVYSTSHETRWEISMEPLPVEPTAEPFIVFGNTTASSTATPASTPRPSTGSPRS